MDSKGCVWQLALRAAVWFFFWVIRQTREPKPRPSLLLPTTKRSDVKHLTALSRPPVFLNRKRCTVNVCVCYDVTMLREAGGLRWGQNGNSNKRETCWQHEKGLLKRLIRPGQAEHIKAWWDNKVGANWAPVWADGNSMTLSRRESQQLWTTKTNQVLIKSPKCYRWYPFLKRKFIVTDLLLLTPISLDIFRLIKDLWVSFRSR